MEFNLKSLDDIDAISDILFEIIPGTEIYFMGMPVLRILYDLKIVTNTIEVIPNERLLFDISNNQVLPEVGVIRVSYEVEKLWSGYMIEYPVLDFYNNDLNHIGYIKVKRKYNAYNMFMKKGSIFESPRYSKNDAYANLMNFDHTDWDAKAQAMEAMSCDYVISDEILEKFVKPLMSEYGYAAAKMRINRIKKYDLLQ